MFGFKLAAAVVITACLMFPGIVGAQCTRCCGIEGFLISLSITPTTAEEDQHVSITIAVSSCYSTVKTFTANVDITPTVSSCAPFADAFTVSGKVFPGQHRIFTYTLPAPKCDSTYDVIMNGAVSATLTVE